MEQKTVCRLLVVDDHPVVRHGLRHILEKAEGMLVAAEAGRAYDALELVRAGSFDAVLLDIALPDMNGLEALRIIRRMKPDVPVLILSIYDEEVYAVRAMKEGASGYLTKGSVSQELVDAVRKVVSGGHYITASLAEKLAVAVNVGADKPRHASLSLREFEVMRMMAQGKTLKSISESLHLSPKTITTYRARILDKMKFVSNEDLVQYAIRNRLID
jgi:two-component system, NarL family, invasion response regulator UvrY